MIDILTLKTDNSANMAKYLNPKNDFIFKRIFGNHPELLKSFLNALLPLPEGSFIKSLSYLTPESVPEIEGLKTSIVDVRCVDNFSRTFIVEMQLQWTPDFIKRMLFNTASTYVRQLKKGQNYHHLNQVYGLALLDAAFMPDPGWYHHYRMTKADATAHTLEDIHLVLIELPKFKPSSIAEKKIAILWLRFLNEINESTETVDAHFFEVAPIKEALNLLEIASYNKQELVAYDQIWDAVSSERTLLHGKFAEGKAQGKVEGKAEGLVEGRLEGKMEGKKEMILSLHQLGFSLEQIALAAKLSLEEITAFFH